MIDISEGIHVNITSKSKEYVFHSWYFLNKCFKFQPNVCNRCYDLLMMPINLSGTVIWNIENSDHRCIINEISKNETMNLMQNVD